MAVSKVILNGNTLIDTTDKTVTAGSMLSGITALKNDGTTATGSIASKTSSDLTASNLTVTAPAGHYASAATKTLSDENLVAGNIKKDVVIFGTTGSYEGSGGGQTVYTSSSGLLYTPIMTIDISMERANGYLLSEALGRYGEMPYLEELTLTGIARRGTSTQLISNYPNFSTSKFPLLKKLHLEPTEIRAGNGAALDPATDADYNDFTFGHYIFNQTNLTELTIGKVDGPFFKGGGYFRNDMSQPPGTSGYQVGSVDGLTIKIYTDEYRAVGGFSVSLAPNTTLIEYDYTTGEVLTP